MRYFSTKGQSQILKLAFRKKGTNIFRNSKRGGNKWFQTMTPFYILSCFSMIFLHTHLGPLWSKQDDLITPRNTPFSPTKKESRTARMDRIEEDEYSTRDKRSPICVEELQLPELRLPTTAPRNGVYFVAHRHISKEMHC